MRRLSKNHFKHWREFELSKDCVILVTTVGQYSLTVAEDRYLTLLYAAVRLNHEPDKRGNHVFN